MIFITFRWTRHFIIIMEDQNNSRNQQQFSFVSAVIQIIVVILGIVALANVTMKIRLSHLVESTKTIFSQFSKMSVKDICEEILRTYIIYILLLIILIICIFYIARKILSSRVTLYNSFPSHYSSRYLKPITAFLLLFYLINIFITSQSRREYTKFYNDFKQGAIGTQFMGYKVYHFLNHADETNRILTHLSQSAKNEEQTALVENVKNLVKIQDKNPSAFRSYIANYNLIFKLINIFYYFCGFIGMIGMLILFSIHNCFLSDKQGQSQYGSLQQHQQEDGSQQALVKCPQEETKRKWAQSLYIFIILIVFSGAILANFILGDIFIQLKTGHPYNRNLEQKEVCSFHKHIGGFFINIDYQNQLSLLQQFHQLQKKFEKDSEKVVQLVENLQKYLKIYITLCEILQPYYLNHKELQCRLSELFYRHFYAFIFLYWRYYRILRELKTERQQN